MDVPYPSPIMMLVLHNNDTNRENDAHRENDIQEITSSHYLWCLKQTISIYLIIKKDIKNNIKQKKDKIWDLKQIIGFNI